MPYRPGNHRTAWVGRDLNDHLVPPPPEVMWRRRLNKRSGLVMRGSEERSFFLAET